MMMQTFLATGARMAMASAALTSRVGIESAGCSSSTAQPPSRRPPRVAFCIAGAARAFASPLVLESLRTNLVAPLAGPDAAASGSRLFLSLKVSDSAALDECVKQAEARELVACPIADAGRTEVAPGTVTCCAIGPAENPRIDEVTGRLSLFGSGRFFSF